MIDGWMDRWMGIYIYTSVCVDSAILMGYLGHPIAQVKLRNQAGKTTFGTSRGFALGSKLNGGCIPCLLRGINPKAGNYYGVP
jgi:hypothetical protein